MPTSPNFGWTEPTVGGDVGTWGTVLNAMFDAIDADVWAIKGTADGAMKADGTVPFTSRIKTLAEEEGALISTNASGTVAVDLKLYNTLVINGTVGDVTITFSNAAAKLQRFRVYVLRSSVAHKIGFVINGVSYMTADAGIWNWNVGSTAYKPLMWMVELDLYNGDFALSATFSSGIFYKSATVTWYKDDHGLSNNGGKGPASSGSQFWFSP